MSTVAQQSVGQRALTNTSGSDYHQPGGGIGLVSSGGTFSLTVLHRLLAAEPPRLGVVSDPVRHGRDEGQDVWQF